MILSLDPAKDDLQAFQQRLELLAMASTLVAMASKREVQ